MDTDLDLLYTNRIISGHQGYGLTDELRRHQFRSHMEKKEIILPDTPELSQVLPDDILHTNPVITDDFKLREMKTGAVAKEKRLLLHISSVHRDFFDIEDVTTVSTSDTLNNAFVPASTDVFRPYFTDADGNVKKLVYKDQYPNYYTIHIPELRHVKAIRLLSTEIPNTIGNITGHNNILILSIRSSGTTVTYNTSKTEFPFIIVQLDLGYYQTLQSLLSHLESKLNSYALDYVTTPALPPDLFTVTYNSNTGKISIAINSAYDATYDFHLKMFFEVDGEGRIISSHYDYLWYMLGFPWPYEIDTDGTDLFYTETTNLFNFGLHPIFTHEYGNYRQQILADNTDFITHATSSGLPEISAHFSALEATNGTSSDYLELTKPYRIPSIDHRNVVFMFLNDIGHIENSMNISAGDHGHITDRPYFAKIQMNSDYGTVSYNTHIDSPFVYFTAPLARLNKLRVGFYDENGTLVDFGNVDHSFTLEIITYIDVLESAYYSSQRGTVDPTSVASTLGTSNAPSTSSTKTLTNANL